MGTSNYAQNEQAHREFDEIDTNGALNLGYRSPFRGFDDLVCTQIVYVPAISRMNLERDKRISDDRGNLYYLLSASI